MLRVGTGFYIPSDYITFVGNYETVSIKRKAHKMMKEGNCLDLTKNNKSRSIIFYTDMAGMEHGVIVSNTTETILQKINELKKGKNGDQ